MILHPDSFEFDFERIARRLSGAAAGPGVLVLHPTLSCNHNCDWCWYDHPQQSVPFWRIIAGLSRGGLQDVEEVIIAGGGEPLMYPHLSDLVLYVRQILPHTYLKLFTNGSLLNRIPDSVVSEISYLRVSLDAINAEDYAADRSVPRSIFGRVLAGMARVASLGGPDIGVSFLPVHDYDEAEFLRFVERLRGMGVRWFILKPLLTQALTRYDSSFDSIQPRSDLYVWRSDVRNPVVPAELANYVVHAGPDGKVYPCSHREGKSEWEVALLEELTPEDLYSHNVTWDRQRLDPHACRVFDSWGAYTEHGEPSGCSLDPGGLPPRPEPTRIDTPNSEEAAHRRRSPTNR